MTPLFALRTLLFAGELLAGSMLIMALGWIFASQRRASARHLSWAGAFGAVLILPLLATIVPSPLRILLPAPPEAIPVQSLSDAASAATLPTPIDSGIALDPTSLALALGALWLLGIAILSLRFAASAICLASLRRRSRPFALAPQDVPRIAATRRECELRISDSESGPITWGLFQPVILLPRTAIFWPRERLHAVLLHELAHIRRRDGFVQVLSLFVCTLYWPNPLVWLGARALRRDAEMAADDAALVAGVKPSTYAEELLALAAEFRMRAPSVSALSLFMASPSALEARVESVLEPTTHRASITTMDVIRIAGLSFVAAGAIALACPSLAQDEKTRQPVETAPLPPLAPPAPPAPEIPPAPEAPVAPEAPPAPPAPSIGAERVRHYHVHGLTRADHERIHSAIVRAQREAREAVARARPEIERAIAEARNSEEAARAVREAQPEIDAAVANAAREAHEAVASIQPEMERAAAEAKISEHAMEAAREAEPAIDAAWDRAIAKYDSRKVQMQVDHALAEAREEIARAHIDAKIEERVNDALARAEQKLKDVRTRDDDSGDDENGNRNNDSAPDNDDQQ
jgi:beta-lactamase regulating signal transducer with metallopeptidase domain